LEASTLLDAAPSFVAPQDFPTAQNPTQAVIGYFTGNGIPDLAVADRNAQRVSILLGNGDGTFSPPLNFAVRFSPNSLAVGDFDGDGVPECHTVGLIQVTGEAGGMEMPLVARGRHHLSG
jgi:hypothetical protein